MHKKLPLKNGIKQMKTAIVSNIEENYREYKLGGKLYYVHGITFDNDDSGDFSSPNPKCIEFIKGQQTTYNIEPNGGYADKIKPIKEKPSFGKKSPEEQEAILKMSVFSSICNLHRESSKAADPEFMTKEFLYYLNLLKTTK